MVLKAAYALATHVLPTGYYWHTAIGVGSVVITYAFAQGKTTDRERDLHARTILVTGAFTPLGLTTISNLASRGANVIALSPFPLEHPCNTLIIPAIRSTTKNENIFAEHADLTSSASVRAFCTKFLTEGDQRLDGIVFAHEYTGAGSMFANTAAHEQKREVASLASFLFTTLLLPALLVAPVERDIRIVNVVNPFYAAAIPSFNADLIASMSPDEAPRKRPLFLAEGHRALRTIVLTRHLQRILNALPNRAPTLDSKTPGGVPPEKPSPKEAQDDAEDKSKSKFPSNIVAVTVAPGISRTETVRVALGADKSVDPEGYSTFGFVLHILLFPFIWLLAKSSDMATQTVIHALFLPTPFKRALAHLAAATAAAAAAENASPEAKKDEGPVEIERPAPNSLTEILKPGALYRECSVVTLPLPPLPEAPSEDSKDGAKSSKAKKSQKNGEEKTDLKEEVLDIEDDGEYGGERVGRLTWEWFEAHLKAWEAKEEKPEEGVQATASATSSSTFK
ncbi:hypothetical protein PsYK624_109060 [Phanerochaete sordida]|uniref:Ketoreductase (KR) domain-containing protein n=1 Tax=Phanerochaete sordida TaxID=48140 RepID=A0A9P3LGW4_9APHY|nr:hypothetical protein PsYK624_109060 [Phanerochaete sordida]